MRSLRWWLVALVVASLFVGPLLAAKSRRWAGRGAAGGAILGLLVGDDLGDVAVGAAVGAAGGAIAGDISENKKKQREEQARLQELERREAEARNSTVAADLPQTEEEWIAAIGEDNTRALDALVECQHDRARLLAQAGATFDNAEFRLVAGWLEALVAVDQRDTATAEKLFDLLIERDNDVDTRQQAALLADQAILEIRRTREKEGIVCRR